MWRGDSLPADEIALLTERFWANVNRTPGKECWEWQGACVSGGYGQLIRLGVHIGTHRLSWFIHNGIIPPGLWVLHECDNPPCVRPSHLFLGTRLDNVLDMIRKGRANRRSGADHPMNQNHEFRLTGTKNGRALLTDDDVREIRTRAGQGERVSDLARETGMSEGALRHIVKRRHWRHVE